MGLTRLSRKTFLSIYISHSCVYANFAYTNGDNKRQEILRDKSLIVGDFEGLLKSDFVDFWLSYFKSLEQKWNLKILEKPKVENGSVVIDFNVGCKVALLRSNPNYKLLFSSLRDFSLDIRLFAADKDFERDLLNNLAIFLN